MGRPRPNLPADRSAANQRGNSGNSSTTLLTVVLAILLLAVGAAGYEAANLLHFAIVPPTGVNTTAASAAAFVCDALKQQDYQRLVAIIDPAPIPPAVTGAFDAHQTIAQLQAQDANAGKVVSCATAPYDSGSVVSTDGATRYQLTLRRAKAATSVSGTLVLRQQSGGAHGWLIERDSSFLTPSAA
jgi:hypothetical protein